MNIRQQLVILLIIMGTLSGCMQKNLVILHTNDTHSRIEPIPTSDKDAPGMGGVARRSTYIDGVRKDNKNVLLFDAGDFLQGTPYFNLFEGEVEIKTMNLMKYDAATLGNHEFDYGWDVLKEVVTQAEFPIVSSNYDFSNTPLSGMIPPYLILKKGGVKIGVIGINVKPEGLIAADHYKGLNYLDPVKTANDMAAILRGKHNCDIIVCLSHLGYIHDTKLAEASRYIDFILGGHSHTYMKEPAIFKNLDDKDVMLFQTAGRGVHVAKLEIELQRKNNKNR